MSLSCPVLNDIIIEEINQIKIRIKNLSNNSVENISNNDMSEKYKIFENALKKIQNTLDIYKAEQLNNASLNEKIENILNNINKKDSYENYKKISKLENNIEIINNKLDEFIQDYNKQKNNNSLGTISNKDIHILIDTMNSKLLNTNIEINKINTSILNIIKRIEYLERRKNFKNHYNKQNNYKYKESSVNYNKDNTYSNENNDENTTSDGWTKVSHKKRYKKF